MKLACVGSKLLNLAARIFRPRPPGGVKSWAAGSLDGNPNIFLSAKESGDFPGAYDPELNPLPTVLFEVWESGKYKKAVFKKSSQAGVTLAVLIFICYWVGVVVRNFIYVIDSLDEMRRISQERLQPMLRACPAVAAEQIPEDADEMKTLTLSLRGCVGYLMGAQSLGALSNKSAGLVIYDEVDAYPSPPAGRERAMELGAERGKRQTGFFEVWLSKPTLWDGPINQEYLIGSRHKAKFPCPHCGTFQEMNFEQLRAEHCRDATGQWDFSRVLRETFLLCISEECQQGPESGRILEKHKPEMVKRRRWEATNSGQDEYKPDPEIFSCEITDMASTFPGTTWGVLMVEYLRSEGNAKKRQTFLRGRLARPERKEKTQARDDDIRALAGEYVRGQCPEEPDVILFFADVQGTVKKWVKCGFLLRDDSCFVIDYGECLSFGDLSVEVDVPVEVLRWRPETPVAARVGPVVYKGLVDEGYEQKAVRSWAVKTMLPQPLPSGAPDFRFFTSWGQGGMHARHLRDLVVPRMEDPPNAMQDGIPFFAYRFSDDNFKDELYNRRLAGARKAREAAAAGRVHPDLVPPTWFPADMTPDFISELCQESYGWNPKTKRNEWLEVKKPNDYGDGVKGCLVAWYIVKPALAVAAAKARAERLRAIAAAAASGLTVPGG